MKEATNTVKRYKVSKCKIWLKSFSFMLKAFDYSNDGI